MKKPKGNRQGRDGGTRQGDEVRAPSRPAPQQAPYHEAAPKSTPVKDIFPDPTAPRTMEYSCCVCGETNPMGDRLKLHNERGEHFVTCSRECLYKERERRREIRRQTKIPLSPEQLAMKCEILRKARLKRHQIPAAIQTHILTGETPVSHRHHQVLVYYLMGLEPMEIARAVGYKHARKIHKVLALPHMKAAIRKVEEMQLERIVSGEFGVHAAAKANAGRAMKRIIDEVDNADAAPRERLKASELNLKISGDLVDKKVHAHLHTLVKGFTDDELRDFVQHKRWPERLRPLVEKLGLPAPDATTH